MTIQIKILSGESMKVSSMTSITILVMVRALVKELLTLVQLLTVSTKVQWVQVSLVTLKLALAPQSALRKSQDLASEIKYRLLIANNSQELI